ncbi:hypothetical protein [Mycoplasmoides genitalium]
MPKVVVEYHKLSKKVVKESLGVDTSGSTLIQLKGCKKIVRWRIQQKQWETQFGRWWVNE